MPMLLWVGALSGYMHRGVPEVISDPLRHDANELEKRIREQKTFGVKDYEGILTDVAARDEQEQEQRELAELARQHQAAQAAQQLLDAALAQIRGRPVSAPGIYLHDPARFSHIRPMIAPPRYDDDDEAIALLLLH